MSAIPGINPDNHAQPETSQIRMEALDDGILLRISSCLGYGDQAKFARVARSIRNAEQQWIAPLRTEIENLTEGPLTCDNAQQLLVRLITFSEAGYHRQWVPVMDALMKRLVNPDGKIQSTIQSHANIADLLATSQTPISPGQVYQFCRYLGHRLSEMRTWVGYRALEQYLLKPQLDAASVMKAQEEYLAAQATKCVRAEDRNIFTITDEQLSYQEIDIDPRNWFGLNSNSASLWEPHREPHGDEVAPAPMPAPVLEALWNRIQTLRAADRPVEVGMTGRTGAELPLNFTLPLARRITDAGMFLDCNNTIDPNALEHPEYTRLIFLVIDELRERYPNAVRNRQS